MNYPNKEQLEYDYFSLNLNQDQMAEKYGYKTRQVIGRLFKKYGIKSKSKRELANQRDEINNPIPPKEVIEQLYQEKEYEQDKEKALNRCIRFLTS